MSGGDAADGTTAITNTTQAFSQLNLSNTNAKFPYLKKGEYELWAMKMQNWITNADVNLLKVI